MKTVFGVLLFALASISASAGEADWKLRFDGLGPLTIGMPFDQANQAVGKIMQRTPKELRGNPYCDYIQLPGSRIALMFVDDILGRVDLAQSGGSDTGIAIGTPDSQVYAAYEQVYKSKRAYADTGANLTVRAAKDKLAMRFEIEDGKVVSLSSGRADLVKLDEECL
ncbi:hypothetical protein [Massilia sp. BJB1822]|uniref:hypothetical protein n=1 Tax=Massilia sp. BJB1822 TaxID=2744470 RepID=UPI001594AD06|nr:hypothetical protein [Massilia sp. BJB1822]NVD99816.1 hypothetical protein [Massilia sp. BJB1822]